MTMTSVTVTVKIASTAPTVVEVANAVRRAASALDKAVLVPGAPMIAKGVSFTPRALKTAEKVYSPVREWAAKNGHPEVVGKRGRLSKTIIAEYESATK